MWTASRRQLGSRQSTSSRLLFESVVSCASSRPLPKEVEQTTELGEDARLLEEWVWRPKTTVSALFEAQKAKVRAAILEWVYRFAVLEKPEDFVLGIYSLNDICNELDKANQIWVSAFIYPQLDDDYRESFYHLPDYPPDIRSALERLLQNLKSKSPPAINKRLANLQTKSKGEKFDSVFESIRRYNFLASFPSERSELNDVCKELDKANQMDSALSHPLRPSKYPNPISRLRPLLATFLQNLLPKSTPDFSADSQAISKEASERSHAEEASERSNAEEASERSNAEDNFQQFLRLQSVLKSRCRSSTRSRLGWHRRFRFSILLDYIGCDEFPTISDLNDICKELDEANQMLNLVLTHHKSDNEYRQALKYLNELPKVRSLLTRLSQKLLLSESSDSEHPMDSTESEMFKIFLEWIESNSLASKKEMNLSKILIDAYDHWTRSGRYFTKESYVACDPRREILATLSDYAEWDEQLKLWGNKASDKDRVMISSFQSLIQEICKAELTNWDASLASSRHYFVPVSLHASAAATEVTGTAATEVTGTAATEVTGTAATEVTGTAPRSSFAQAPFFSKYAD